MAKTIAELRNRALTMTGKLALGQTPSGALASDMEDAYNQVYARLKARDLVTWSSTDDVPDEFVEDITALMAFERSEGIPSDRYGRIANAASRAVNAISSTIAGRWINPRNYTDF